MATLVELATTILENVRLVQQHLDEANLPHPSFSIDSLRSYPTESPELDKSRDAALSDLEDLRCLLLGPSEAVQCLGESHNELVSLHAIYKFGMATSFPIGSECTFEDVANTCSLSEHVTRRLMRHAMANHIFCEPRRGVVAHTALSQVLAEDQVLHDFAGVATDELWNSATKVVDALQSWPLSDEPSHTAFALANDTQNPFYVELGQDRERARRFANAMRTFSADADYSTAQLLEDYDWEALGEALVVDVGGSTGQLSIALAQRFPQLSFFVQDSEEIIVDRPIIPDEDVRDRIDYMVHDMFEPQPVVHADVYYLRWIMHGWPDAHCVRILQALIPALKPGARVILHEYCVPECDEVTAWRSRRMRFLDISQMILLNSRERTLTEWENLFISADHRFRFDGIKAYRDTLVIMEAVWTGDD